ncbi:hypothetical protein [Bacillus wiedmannii]|uniref:hypothetical protein n=1 Tax=Bacillus wiedmannii TaxID=1890302 RepID=UPI001E5FCDFE|nr:hypothetical protein [Bacillus wiedmannii]MCC2425444.1 hypothetical protein [Bacillus wiedmannii]
MTEEKRRITLNFTEQEWAALEFYAEKNEEKLGETIAGYVLANLFIPEELWSEEKKRREYPYTLFFEDGNPDKLTLEIRVEGETPYYYDEDYEEYVHDVETSAVIYNRSEKKFMFWDEEHHVSQRYFNKLFSFFGEEIFRFAETMQVGQMVENGVLEEDEDRPHITKEQVDEVFEQCIKLHTFTLGDLNPVFYFLNTTDIVGKDRRELEDNKVFQMVLKESKISKLSTSEPLLLEDFHFEFGYVRDSIGYFEIEKGKEVYPNFKKRIEEEMIPQMIGTREFKALKMASLFD